MSDLFSNLIERAQNAAPAVHPLHPLYRTNAVDNLLTLNSDATAESVTAFNILPIAKAHSADMPIQPRRVSAACDFMDESSNRLMSNRGGGPKPRDTATLAQDNSAETVQSQIPFELLDSRSASRDVPQIELTRSNLRADPYIRSRETDSVGQVASIQDYSKKPRRRTEEVPADETTSRIVNPSATRLQWDQTVRAAKTERANFTSGQFALPQTPRKHQFQEEHVSVVEQEERHVTVSIGRLEVRINSTSGPKSTATPARNGSALSDYQRERAGGGA